jgi:hypothetical protein
VNERREGKREERRERKQTVHFLMSFSFGADKKKRRREGWSEMQS